MVYTCVKRLGDILISLVGTIILIPLTLIIKLAYICTGDFHPIFYTQERIGKNGKVFKIIKYRSMVPNADEALKKLLEQKKYRKQWEEYQKSTMTLVSQKWENLFVKVQLMNSRSSSMSY